MSIRLITFSGQTVTPKTDGIIQDASIGQNGIFYGCGVTASGNSLHIDGGYGLIKGRYFEIDATTVPVTLATSNSLLGRLYVKLDLSNTEAPIQMLTATGETLPSLEQDADANFDDGVWEMELATFNITTTEISDLTETYQTITDNASLVSALQTAINTLNSNLHNDILSVIPTSFSVQNNTETTLASLNLTEGKWIITCGAGWGANSNGYRYLFISDLRYHKDTISGINGAVAQQSFVIIEDITAPKTITLKGKQTSGSSISVFPFIRAIRLPYSI